MANTWTAWAQAIAFAANKNILMILNTGARVLRIRRIACMHACESITPEKMDTSNASLPTQIKIYKNPVVLLAGHKLGAIMINPSFRRAIQQIYGTGPGFSGVDLSGVNYTSKTLDNYKTDIRLKEGQGLAIIKKSASEMGKFEIHVEFAKMDLGIGGPPPDVAYPIIGGGHIIQVDACMHACFSPDLI